MINVYIHFIKLLKLILFVVCFVKIFVCYVYIKLIGYKEKF